MKRWGIGFIVVFGLTGTLTLGIIGAIVYVAVHFLAKVW